MPHSTNLTLIRGSSFIELMVALTLSLFILGLVSKIYLTAQQNFLFQSALHEIQQKHFQLSAIFHAEIPLAGYIGCAKLTETFPIAAFAKESITIQNKITIEPHRLTVRHASLAHANLLRNMQSAAHLYATLNPVFSVGDIVLISDCEQAEIFQIKKVTKNKDRQVIEPAKPLQLHFKKYAEIALLEINSFYVADTGRKTERGKPVNALYKRYRTRTTELIEGVEDFTITQDAYGVLLTAKVSAYPLNKSFHSYFGLS